MITGHVLDCVRFCENGFLVIGVRNSKIDLPWDNDYDDEDFAPSLK